MRLQLRFLLAAVAIGFLNPMAQATDITFDFRGSRFNHTSLSLTSNGYTLNLTNPVNMGNNGSLFFIDSDGLGVGYAGGPVPQTASFDMQVTGGPLQFKSYDIPYLISGTVGTFSLTGGTGTSTGNPLNPTGTYSFAGTKIISPGDTVTLNALFNLGPNPFSQIGSITFSTVTVPEPSTYALGAISVMTLGFMARRRRRLQSQKA